MPATSNSSGSSKRAGKENVPVTKSSKVTSKKAVVEEDDLDGDTSMGGFSVEDESGEHETGVKGKGETSKVAEMKRRLKAMTSERDRLRSQRETISKQFEELSRLRKSEVETLFDKYKEKASVQVQAQNDIIANLSTLNDKYQEKVQSLEKALAQAMAEPPKPPPGKPDPEEVRRLKEDINLLKSSIKRKEERYQTLEKEYKAEQQHSQSLQSQLSSKPPSSSTIAAAVSTSPGEAEKDAACLRLYEDLSELCVANVKVNDAGKAGKDVTFNCVQTRGPRSLNFKLRAYNHLDPALVKSKVDNPWVRSIQYTPEGLEHETDQIFVSRLGVFAQSFSVPRDQLRVLFDELRDKMDQGVEEE